MISLLVLFWILVVIFAIVGAMRGVAKEALVFFSVILALFFNFVMQEYLPLMQSESENIEQTRFWIQTGTMVVLVIIGYETPRLPAFAGPKFLRERSQDAFLGLGFGAGNGLIIVGSIWYYLDEAGYFPPNVLPPVESNIVLDTIGSVYPLVVNDPWIYLAVGVALLLVLWQFV
jgi:uncharacterized membrane protein required for colicin V production